MAQKIEAAERGDLEPEPLTKVDLDRVMEKLDELDAKIREKS
jgi:hypothetical protein